MLSFIGASTALVLIYTVPPIVNMIYYKRRHVTKFEKLKLEQKKTNDDRGTIGTTVHLANPERNSEEGTEDDEENSSSVNASDENVKEPKVYKPFKTLLFYLSMIITILIGLFTFAMQIYPVNFFNIHIKKAE